MSERNDIFEILPRWEYVADTVMGGVSRGEIARGEVQGREATRLTGHVSLENSGGFIQMECDLMPDGSAFDSTSWAGIELELRGNGKTYELRLRTDQLSRPWQSFRAEFLAPGHWATLRIPFAELQPHRTDLRFDPAHLKRIGVVAIGREFEADIAVSAVRLYSETY